ncbi:MAG: hypothetical protein NC831_03860 [Candidatus Omnitrophica bacterium]|nr:hypothetical protein [Candidatus Omnitrophota bacterium]
MGYFLKEKVDFKKHNEEARRLWDDYKEKKHNRVPVTIGGSIRNFFENPYLNTDGYTFYQFYNDFEIHIRCQLLFQKWWRENILCDREMGAPERWQIGIDFQNNCEAGWFGCKIIYPDKFTPPDTEPIFRENKYKLYEMKAPDPLKDNLMKKAMEFFDYINGRCKNLEFEGRPVMGPATIPGEWTDGPFTVEKYRHFVFPFHKRIIDEFSDGSSVGIHLCGNAYHLFGFLKDNLNICSFDTGFPIDSKKVREELGNDVEIMGGPNIVLLKNGTQQDISEEVKRICDSGIMTGKRFIMREGNNLAPMTPVENIVSMYKAAKLYGRYNY